MFKSLPKGRVVEAQASKQVANLIGPGPHARHQLIEHLHLLQDRFGGIRKKQLVALADLMRLSMSEVYEVATFYHHFSVLDDDAPAPAPIKIRVCESLSCAMAGAQQRYQDLASLSFGAGGKKFSVEKAPCLGLCDQAPAAVVGEFVPMHLSAAQLRQQLKVAPEKVLKAQVPRAAQTLSSYLKQGGYAQFKRVFDGALTPNQIIEALTQAQLRGLGGAGFPAARKWQAVRAQAGEHLMVVNVDEGEPGTFKDKFYLEREPHRFIEGMLIAAHCNAVSEIYIYIRDEYPVVRKLLAQQLGKLARYAAQQGFALPPIHLRRGAGAYICGEESALIESLEGKRGEPRLKPPIVAEKGLFGLPTLAHNPETLMWVVTILTKGAQWYAQQGVRGRTGLRSFSVSGRVKKPGVYAAAAGTTLNELIALAGGMAKGHVLYAFLPGGASGGLLPASLANEALDFDVLAQYGAFIGSAAVVVLSEADQAKDAATNLMAFFAHESCGQCTPCRSGTVQSVRLMEQAQWDQATLTDLADVMADASICGLGQAAANPIRSVIRFFGRELAPQV
jgi:formate dehydrogenase beta subunit